MVNLINEKQKIVLVKEYILRLTSVCLLVLALLGLFALAYIVPYYLSVLNNDIVISKQLESAIQIENKENIGENINQTVLKTNEQIMATEVMANGADFVTRAVDILVLNKNSGIRIDHLVFKNAVKEGGQVFINGLAKDRQSLVTFLSSLKNEVNLSEIESPVSDFAKQVNIPFTINFKVKI